MFLPFGAYEPDKSDYNAKTTTVASNVFPRADGWGPVKDFTIFTSALPAPCRGYFFAHKSDGSVAIFAGTSTKLYLLNNTDFTWTDVSQSAGSYSALSSDSQWQFAQHGSNVVAVQANVAPQVYTLGSSTEFADLSGSPPQAAYVAVVLRFLVLSGLLNNPNRIHWSGLNDITEWTSGVNQSDYQDFPDGGFVRGVAGGEFGLITQDSAIRRMTYAPGSPVVFQIDKVTQDHGILGAYALIRDGDRIFFYSPRGFYQMTATGYPQPIGKERVDRTFSADLDTGNLQLFIGAADPRESRVYWAYRSLSGSSDLFDRVISYDWALDRWSPPIEISGQYIAALSRPGITLENLDDISSSIDALPFSLDDVSTVSIPNLSAVDSADRLGFYNGSNLEATLYTSEQSSGAQTRLMCNGFKPITDAAEAYGSIMYRDLLGASATTSGETVINGVGICPQRKSARYMRSKLRIPAEAVWTFASGVEPIVQAGGLR